MSDDKQSKSWIRAEIMQALRFWAPILELNSFVDHIIVEMDHDAKDDEYAACVQIDTTTRTATITVSRDIVACYSDRYPDIQDPSDIISMIMLHECLHIITHPMSNWASTAVDGSSRESSLLANFFEAQEETTVEHLTRVFFSVRDYLETPSKFKGKLIYRVKKKRENKKPVVAAKKKSRRKK